MEYNSENDEYICVLGRRLKNIGVIKEDPSIIYFYYNS